MKCYLENLIIFENERKIVIRFRGFKNAFLYNIREYKLEEQVEIIKEVIETTINKGYELLINEKILIQLLLEDFKKGGNE